MIEVEDRGNSITLKAYADLKTRIELLTLLFEKAESKVTHVDMFRQRNMNYSLIIFAGLIALGVKLLQYLAQSIVSATLLMFMLIFGIWDRRWHKIKHGWQSTAKDAFHNICELTNNPKKEITVFLYSLKPRVTLNI